MQRLKPFILFIIVFPLHHLALSQDFKAIDKHALKTPKSLSNDLPKLVNYLSKKSTNDLEKVRSFYTWIIHNISYDNTAYKKGNKRINHSNQDVLRRNKAVCQGYSNLFKEMCELENIKCEVITGYHKTPRDALPNLSAANHTWNVVKLDNNWHLLDVTWGAGNQQKAKETYFLTPPETFILDHLPNDPMWQLLDCPIPVNDFQKSEKKIFTQLSKSDSCFNYLDSIARFMSLPLAKGKLKTAQSAYRYHPNEENKKVLGSTYMDYNSFLTDRSTELEQTDSLEAILDIQLEMIKTCETASTYITLFDSQKENLAYTHFNYGVALSQQIQKQRNLKDKEIINTYQTMLYHFKKGQAILKDLPQNFLSQNALRQLEEYIEYVYSKLDVYK